MQVLDGMNGDEPLHPLMAGQEDGVLLPLFHGRHSRSFGWSDIVHKVISLARKVRT
jgi:hypothetical protein